MAFCGPPVDSWLVSTGPEPTADPTLSVDIVHQQGGQPERGQQGQVGHNAGRLPGDPPLLGLRGYDPKSDLHPHSTDQEEPPEHDPLDLRVTLRVGDQVGQR